MIAQTLVRGRRRRLLVDGELVTSPYVIDVIGEPHTLAGGMSFPRGPVDQLEDDGAEVDIEEFSSLDIESVVDPAQPQFAEPAAGAVACLRQVHPHPLTEGAPCTPTT